ncbi:hypothetical protein AUP74_01765 [Microbulbifer aggregans]|uniref:DUF1972 domain-containing protein n=1 Tax=Microbulbifer aggregans TaxID=1769779 RepID=A0A1C9W7S8_9GAMM|nr:DUF1972 domain-containing protein [Microbulbifer aggregans]AOS97196.1 hypothetical protein AUP74_01765 [Microbulbifer aggregans]
MPKKRTDLVDSGSKTVRILGTRGVPASHGGFETFAEKLALYLVDRGWQVVVYCQEEGAGKFREDDWNGIARVIIPEPNEGALGTIRFDWKAISHAAQHKEDLMLVLGYNTAFFCLIFRLKGIANIINMDGIEWKRAKWGAIAKTWFWLNERFGCWFGNHLIADHPEIKRHLATRVSENKITMIPYGADQVLEADPTLLGEFGLEPYGYAIVVARPEPENSILQIVKGFSEKKRGRKLILIGNYDISNTYHKKVMASASEEVIFPGAIYDKVKINALRRFSFLYIHGHTVGGTNPSLVEALGAGLPVLAHENKFNRWVAGEGNAYFEDENSFSIVLEDLLSRPLALREMSLNSRALFDKKFRWNMILEQYEQLMQFWLSGQSVDEGEIVQA